MEDEGEGGEVEMKCPDCGGEVTYYHPCIVHGDGITRVVCSKKCKGWKVIKKIDRNKKEIKGQDK